MDKPWWKVYFPALQNVSKQNFAFDSHNSSEILLEPHFLRNENRFASEPRLGHFVEKYAAAE